MGRCLLVLLVKPIQPVRAPGQHLSPVLLLLVNSVNRMDLAPPVRMVSQ